MTATVHRGILLGNGTNHLQNFYTNSTGGNVRIVWYYMNLGNTSPYECRLFVGSTTPTAPTDPNQSLDYTWPGDASTMRFDNFGTGNFYTGKHIGIAGSSAYGAGGAGGPSSGHFPTELILPNGDKMWLYVPNQIGTAYYEFAMRYNFIEIPE